MATSSSVLEALHRQCSGHRATLELTRLCGCFYCKRTFLPTAILDWVDDEGTALCPFCGIDSVVPESSEIELTQQLLDDMHAYWFERSVTLRQRPSLLQRFMLRLEPVRRRIKWLLNGNRAA